MKRNMDLARKILFRLEEQPDFSAMIDLNFEGFSEEEVYYHIMLLAEADLIIATDASAASDIVWFPQRLTWNGHEFVDAARDDKRWKQAQDIMAKTGGFVLEIAKPLLIELMKSQVREVFPGLL